MTIIRHGRGRNPLAGFKVDPGAIRHVGRDLNRPECILAERDGSLWTADARGGVVHIAPDGTQRLVLQETGTAAGATGDLLSGTLPNGLAFAADGDVLVSNFGTDRLERMTRSGRTRVVLDSIDGRPLGKVNFVLRDSKDRLWITVSTTVNPWSEAISTALADGYVVLVDEKGPRIVADGFRFTNEIRLDATEEWLYVAETTGKCVTRLRVQPDGSLTDRETYGPSNLGAGLIDGIAFDRFGNLWATMIFADRLVAITPEGNLLELLDDGDAAATRRFEQAFATGLPVPVDVIMACGGPTCPMMTSVTFGGPDLSTVYLGGLRTTSVPSFASPVAGLPMVHW
ncbi:Sugar lactone lactonase YvrE [Methylobacterium sp. 174MFSha1.1]|uniref:SMP-30/gluconolactonase/LRE family protein n=1 Tax=Methylobacterium sp. 174MFSha1.1 TaxID=1502749 RepID=UPI0008E97457|nr:SMP-30/gluconolactonase/LRE family protein [Methylobacterium sp. 174MFSha1.1]SFU75154.1 Sugar lactone lactonase YvrE [Methylobacterium sp. 174MFSha1.1]